MVKSDASETEPPFDADVIYTEAMTTALEPILKALEEVLVPGVKFTRPLPPTVAKVAIMQAITMAAVIFGKEQNIPYAIIKDVLQSTIKLGELLPETPTQ